MGDKAMLTISALISGAIIGSIVGSAYGGEKIDSIYRAEAIAHHAAHYDTVTGKWQWNDEVSP